MSPTKEVASGGSATDPPLVARYLSFLPSSLTYLSLMYLHRSLASSTVHHQSFINNNKEERREMCVWPATITAATTPHQSCER